MASATQGRNPAARLVPEVRMIDPSSTGSEKESPLRFQISKLDVFYGPKQAVFGLNLNIPVNKVTALIGPSGCGKSTFLRTLNRMNETIRNTRVEGEVLLDGQDIHALDVVGLRRAALWDEVKDYLKKSAFALSGGQQQRLCIARALAVDPEVLLLDEPCSALDPISTAKIEELLIQLKENCTIVIVTHNMQQAARVSDFTAFMLMGELVEFNPTPTLFTTPTDPRTEAYITGRFG